MLNRVPHLFLYALLLLLTVSACSPSKAPPVTEIIATGATLQQLDSSYTFTEGPAVDKAGNVYFTDQPNDQIVKWSTDGTLSVFMTDTGRSNGLFFDNAGNLLACADQDNQLWSISMDKEITVLVNDFEGKKLNGPNDLWIDLKGGVYFTDPFYKRPYWDREEKEIEEERLYYLSPDRQSVKVVADGFVRPNGLIGTPDGKMLYVADIGDKKTYSFTINDDASLSNKTLFVEMGSDGMTIDNQGNIYLTGDGVHVFNDAGAQIEHIEVDQRWTANVTLGGKDRQTLFVTAMGSVYSLAMNVKGVR
ncbi:MAG: SMP-30/gluconolactonase/LRE family protein [Rhodothermales bacterium]